MSIYEDIGTGKNWGLVNVSELAWTIGKEQCTARLWLDVFTGDDSTSAFIRKSQSDTSEETLLKVFK